jgi:hypothetical protein
MKIEKYEPTIGVMKTSNHETYVEYSEYEKLNESYDMLWKLAINSFQLVNGYVDLFEEMLDYYKVGGYKHGESVPPIPVLGSMLRESIESYVDSQLECVDESILDEVEHLREYTDHLVNFSKLPCLPKDLELLHSSNLELAMENEELKARLETIECGVGGGYIRDEFRKHVDAAAIFQEDGKYYNRANLKLGTSTIIGGIEWADKEIERLDHEIMGWVNKWDAAIQIAAEAEIKLESIREYLD